MCSVQQCKMVRSHLAIVQRHCNAPGLCTRTIKTIINCLWTAHELEMVQSMKNKTIVNLLFLNVYDFKSSHSIMPDNNIKQYRYVCNEVFKLGSVLLMKVLRRAILSSLSLINSLSNGTSFVTLELHKHCSWISGFMTCAWSFHQGHPVHYSLKYR